MKIRHLTFAIAALAAPGFGVSAASAQGTSAVTFPTPASSTFTVSRFVLGYEFTVTTAMQATALSFYDYQNNGLAVSHQVGLWASAVNIGAGAVNLGTVTVAAGTASPVQDSFRYVTLAMPLTLAPGVTYTLGAYTHTDAQSPGDTIFSQVAGVSYAPNFVFGRAVSSISEQNGLVVPMVDMTSQQAGFFGPGIILAPLGVTVPEPTTWAIVLGGAGTLIAARARRRSRRG